MKNNAADGKSAFRKKLQQPPIAPGYKGSGKLHDKIALITGGDSGIGKSVALYFAREGAHIGIVYLKSTGDALETKSLVEAEDRECVLFEGDIANEALCKRVVRNMVKKFGRIDILVNNAGMHEDDKSLQDISTKQLHRTFSVNLFSCFYITKAVLEHMPEGGSIINTTSVTAYRGSDHLIDYAATKGALVSFTRSLAQNLAKQNIRVNAVAPGPVWTELVIDAFDAAHLKKFGKDTPMGRAGYPYEIAPAYVYLASSDSSYTTGQVIHINGGEIING